MTEEMDRNDGLGLLGDLLPDQRNIHVQRVRLNVHKDRHGADVGNRLGRGNEGERRGDHLVALPYPCGAQRQVERIGPRGHAGSMLQPVVGGDLLFQHFPLRAEDEGGIFHDRADRRIHVLLNRLILDLQVHHRYGHLSLLSFFIARTPAEIENWKLQI